MSIESDSEKVDSGNTKAEYSYDYSGEKKVYNDGRGRTAHRAIVRLVKLLDVVMVSM